MKFPGIVFVDQLFTAVSSESQARRTGARHGHRWSHMWSSDLEALHSMATRIGMRPDWFQNKPGFPHYDLVPTRRAKAIELGAIEYKLASWLRLRRLPTDKRIEGMLRVHQDVKCDVCGRAWRDHPYFTGVLSYDERPFLHEACDGTLLKL